MLNYETGHDMYKRMVNTLLEDYQADNIRLTVWEQEFLDSIQGRLLADMPLSGKQVDVLDSIWEKNYE